jgi:putative DNA primase/helicase
VSAHIKLPPPNWVPHRPDAQAAIVVPPLVQAPVEAKAESLLPWQQQVCALFEPGDYLHIKLIHSTDEWVWTDAKGQEHRRLKTEEYWESFESIMEDESLAALRGFAEKGWNIYICMAVFDREKIQAAIAANKSLPRGKKLPRRTESNIATVDGVPVVRTAAIDCDKDGEASLAKVNEAVAAGRIPPPTIIIQSSTPPAKYQFEWATKGFTLEQQAALNAALQREFGGDEKAKDTVRVLRLAGFQNQKAKYPHKPVATIVALSPAGRYTLDQFKVPLDVPSFAKKERPKASTEQIEFICGQIEENAEIAGFDLGDVASYLGTGYIWCPDECPNANEHSNGDPSGSYVIVLPSGARFYGCQHEHCKHLNWAWFKNYLNELAEKELDWSERSRTLIQSGRPESESETETNAEDPQNESTVDKILKMNIVRGERGLVDLFNVAYGDKFAHVVVKTKGEWMTWNGKIWVPTTSGNIRAHAIKLADLLRDKVLKRLPSENEDEDTSSGDTQKKKSPRELMREIIRSLNKVGEVNKVVTWMESRREMPRTDFDKKPHLFNFNNGTFDLDTLEFRGFRQEDYLTQISSVSYHPDSKCPTFDEFLANAFPSREMREYIQRYFGYCLSGTATEKAAVIFHGLGDNGKTVLLDVMMAIFGYEGEKSYGKSCSWATFDVNKSGALTIRDDLARLHNARLTVCDESDKRMEIAQALFKAVTGGSLITSRGLFRDLFTYVANFKVILATNHRPKIIGDDGATWSRIQDVPMKQSFPKGHPKRIDNLKPRLMAEREGIVCWLIEGWKMFKAAGGLMPPREVLDATSEYRKHSDIQSEFFNDRCVKGNVKDLVANLFMTHKGWSNEVGEPEMTRAEFIEFLRESGFKVEKWVSTHGQPYYAFGLRVRQGMEPAVHEGDPEPEPEEIPY